MFHACVKDLMWREIWKNLQNFLELNVTSVHGRHTWTAISWLSALPSFLKPLSVIAPHQWEHIFPDSISISVNSTSVLHAHVDDLSLSPREDPIHPLSVTTTISLSSCWKYYSPTAALFNLQNFWTRWIVSLSSYLINIVQSWTN
jgi:hypothetical protein